MKLFNLFGKDKNSNDPYWEFDTSKHFKPKLNKGDFLKLTDFDFGWFVLEPLSKMVNDKEHELEFGKRLSFGQKALYYWWYVDAQVTNGGFVQFYYNGHENYVPTIIKGLEYIGDEDMASLIRQADNIYQKKKKLIVKARKKDSFGSDLYDQLQELSDLDDEYYDFNEKTMSKIEEFIRKNPNEFCIDEDGNEFDLKFSGEYKTFHQDGKPKDIFQLENGVINGEYKTFFFNGQLQDLIIYKKGKTTGEKEEFYENGKHKYKVSIDTAKSFFKHEWFYENGNPKKLEHKTQRKDERIGEYKVWHENGQLAETGVYISKYERDGDWLEFYKDGSKKLEAEFQKGKFQVKNCWNEKGEQILKDGTGLYINEYSIFAGTIERKEQEYKNYQLHGLSKSFTNGRLTLSQEFENGIEHGATLSYYNNGNIEEETIYKKGEKVSQKKFDKFKNPYVETTIICEIQNEWLTNRELETADTYPVAKNADDLSKGFKVDKSFFDGYPQDHELSYSYFVNVDDKGNITKMDFLVASNGRITQEVEANISKLKFTPATKDNKPVISYSIVKHSFKLAGQ